MRSRLGLWSLAASAAAMTVPFNDYSDIWRRPQPQPKFRPIKEKYPGQRRAYLVGAWRPMTRAEIAEHNAAVSARKEQR